ncbi:MAG TPA: MarR family transcriptional regulator [Thermoleophilaceae bacterium]|jgi:DNA-binding MarR family transcriptional regulator
MSKEISGERPRRRRGDAARTPASDRERADLLAALTEAARRFQQGTDLIDDAACELLGINRTDSRCIDILDQRGRMAAGELAEAAALSPAAVTTVLDRLERAGYVQRIRDDGDRRRVMVEITPLARERSYAIYGPMGETGTATLSRFSDRDLRTVIRFLEAGAAIQSERAAELRDQYAREGPLSGAPGAGPPPPAGTSAGSPRGSSAG